MEKIILIGGGGHCLSVIDSIEDKNTYEIIGIIDMKEKVGTTIGGYKIIGTDGDLANIYDEGIINAFITLGSIGNSTRRKKLYDLCKSYGFNLPTIIDPTAIISKKSKINEGTFVGKNVIINRNTCIGSSVILNTGCIVEHECFIGDFTHIAPGVKIAGNVSIDHSTHIGIGSTIIQNINIGSNVLIGASSNVIQDIPNNCKAFGNPCGVVESR